VKVIYKDLITERIQRAVDKADREGRRIECIEVTIPEAAELTQYVNRKLWADPRFVEFRRCISYNPGETLGKFYGAEIRVGST
jgi:hypothetical protein